MALIVQKYGGTSVGSVERIASVAERVLKTVKAGNSCSGGFSNGQTTDQLVKLAHQISTNPSRREMDMHSQQESLDCPVEYGIARIGTTSPDWRTGGNCHRGRTPALGFCISNPNGFHGTSRM